jgi:hypothetical protein
MPISDKKQIKNNVHVAVRLKPIGISNDRKKIWKVVSDQTLRYTLTDEVYNFDRVYDENMDTEMIFKDQFMPMIKSALSGYNVTIFAYGQTSSGKTHTMHGD